jgi:hypothetical protein
LSNSQEIRRVLCKQCQLLVALELAVVEVEVVQSPQHHLYNIKLDFYQLLDFHSFSEMQLRN